MIQGARWAAQNVEESENSEIRSSVRQMDLDCKETASDKVAAIQAEQPLLLDARRAAALLGIGVSTLYKLHSSGRVPAPVRLGASVRWRRAELVAWTAADCPPRGRWTWNTG